MTEESKPYIWTPEQPDTSDLTDQEQAAAFINLLELRAFFLNLQQGADDWPKTRLNAVLLSYDILVTLGFDMPAIVELLGTKAILFLHDCGVLDTNAPLSEETSQA